MTYVIIEVILAIMLICMIVDKSEKRQINEKLDAMMRNPIKLPNGMFESDFKLPRHVRLLDEDKKLTSVSPSPAAKYSIEIPCYTNDCAGCKLKHEKLSPCISLEKMRELTENYQIARYKKDLKNGYNSTISELILLMAITPFISAWQIVLIYNILCILVSISYIVYTYCENQKKWVLTAALMISSMLLYFA